MWAYLFERLMDGCFLYLFSFSSYLEGWKAKKKEGEKHVVHKKYHRTCRQVELVNVMM